MDTDRTDYLLRELGLNGYEVAAYLSLLRRESFTPAELSQVADLPRTRIDDVCSALRAKGLVDFPTTSPRTLRALPPSLALTALRDRWQKELKGQEKHVAECADELEKELAPLFLEGQKEDHPLHDLDVYRNPAQIMQVAEELTWAARQEIRVLLRGHSVFSAKEYESLLRVPLERNVRVRVLSSLLVQPAQELGAIVREFLYQGLELRRPEAKQPPLTFLGVDERAVLTFLEEPLAGEATYRGILYRHADMVAALRLVFDTLWEDRRTTPVGRDGHSAGKSLPKAETGEKDGGEKETGQGPLSPLSPSGLRAAKR
ncbi:MAG: hypothetical protein M1380_09510 [Chloroflexi bacterium]|nr:hypothetical protein [Chloroflexota bacterium]